jgi:uncharacterized protein (DUF2062 family)
MSAWRRRFHELRTEGQGAGREACAIGVGIFIGCSPFYGFHLLLSWMFGTVFRLNRLKVYLASNISNPIVAPVLVLAEIQTGTWLRTGLFLPLNLQGLRMVTPWQFGVDLLTGSAVIGAALGAMFGLATYLTVRGGEDNPFFDRLARRAADRYLDTSIAAWEFARAKLRTDPVYREVLFGNFLPSGGRLLDIGCGQGLMLGLLAEAERASREGTVPVECCLPRFSRMLGIELREDRARLARTALGPEAEIVESDARTGLPPQCRAVLLFDVLHMMSEAEQEAILSAAVEALEPGGVILVREVDAAAGWAFELVRAGNRLMALASGAWRQRLRFRTLSQWRECFSRHGLDVEVRPAGRGTPFANYLFRLTAGPAGSAATAPRRSPL